MKWVENCLISLRNSTYPLNVIVIDNLSTDGTYNYIKQNFPEIELINAEANLGFGKANNIGLKIAIEQKADYVFLLNQDAWIETNTIEKLVIIAEENKDYGIISPMHYDGSNQKFDHKFIEYIQQTECPDLLQDLWYNRLKTIYSTTFVNAAAWLIPIACVQLVGGFDPMFPHYGEDVDYVQRVHYNKFKVGISPMAKINHDARVQLWSEIMWNKNRMYTIYLSEIKNINGSLRSNLLVFCKNRFDELTSNLLYRQFRLFAFKAKLTARILVNIRPIYLARKSSLSKKAFLN